ncbi:MAG: DUF4157 domain-containing protein [Crocinitomicaceae bacterium]
MQEEQKHKEKQTSSSQAEEKVDGESKAVQLKDNRPLSAAQKVIQKVGSKQTKKSTNKTGLPDKLKSGIENLSGHSLDDVKVHYNSSKPKSLNAHAYAKGNEIHLAPGQEKHLPHEAWHVVQQKQGRVKATKQLKGKVALNDDKGLEKEADTMGAKAMQMKSYDAPLQTKHVNSTITQLVAGTDTEISWTSKPYEWKIGTQPKQKTTAGYKMTAFINPGEIPHGQKSDLNSSQNDMMEAIKKRLKPTGAQWKTIGNKLVKGHLLNDHLGGPASDKNLFPISKGANGDHLYYVENKAKTLLRNSKGVYYDLVVKGDRDWTNNINSFETTVGEWDHTKSADSGNAKNIEKRVVHSDLSDLLAKDKVVKGAGDTTPVAKHKDEGPKKLVKPASSKSSFKGSKYELILFPSTGGGHPVLYPWKPGANTAAVTNKTELELSSSFTVDEITYTASTKKGTMKGTVFKKGKHLKKDVITVGITPNAKVDYGGNFDKAKIESSYKKLSPVEFDNVEIEHDGLHGEGKLTTKIPLIAGEIDVKLDGEEVSLEKTFTNDNIHLPKPFSIEEAKLTLAANEEALSAEGSVKFGIDKVGKGKLTAKNVAGDKELSFTGFFDFTSSVFDKARVTLNYTAGQLTGEGDLEIGPGKLHGLKEATAKMIYSAPNFDFTGSATPSIPGLSADLEASYGQGVFKIQGTGKYKNSLLDGSLTVGFTNAKVNNGKASKDLSGEFSAYGGGKLELNLPGNIKGEIDGSISPEGEVEGQGALTVSSGIIPGLSSAKLEATYKNKNLKLVGTAKPNIPGITTTLRVSYDKGVMTFEGAGAYDSGMLSGDLTLGFTNRAVNQKGEPIGSPGDHVIPFGKGLLTIHLGKNLKATAMARLLQNGQVEMEGKIGISEPVNFFEKKRLEKLLINKELKLPIAGVTFANNEIGLFAFVGVKSNFFAEIGPGAVNQLHATVKYNPSVPEQTKLSGKVEAQVPASAGLSLTIPAGIRAALEVLGYKMFGVEGRLDLNGLLKAAAHGKFSADLAWSQETGLEFNTNTEVKANADMDFNIKAILSLWAGGYQTEWAYTLGEKKLSPAFEFKENFPIHYKERQPFNLSASDLSVQSEGMSEDIKDVGKSAGKEAFAPANIKKEIKPPGTEPVVQTEDTGGVQELKIYLGTTATKPHTVPWSNGAPEGSEVHPEISKLFKVSKISFDKDKGGIITGVAFDGVEPLKTVENVEIKITSVQGMGIAGLIEARSVISAFSDKIIFQSEAVKKLMGPIDLKAADFGAEGLNVIGDFVTQVPVLKDVPVDFAIKDDDMSLSAEFSPDEINAPKQLKPKRSTVKILANKEKVELSGEVVLPDTLLGTGFLRASLGSEDGIKLAGEFYPSKGFFKGGKTTLTYQNGTFHANWTADMESFGLKSGKLDMLISKSNYKIGGDFEFKDVPGLSKGKVHAEFVWKGGLKYDMVASGTAIATILGHAINLEAKRQHGAWLMSAEKKFEGDWYSGNLKVGYTTLVVDENGEPGTTPAEEGSFFGGGELNLALTDWLEVTGGAKILPNGEPEIKGGIRLASAKTFFAAREYKHPPFNYPNYTVPLPLMGWGLELKIGGGGDFNAKVGPGELQELSANTVINLGDKRKSKVDGTARLALPAKLNLRIFGNAKIGTSAYVASVHGGIEVGGGLSVNLPNSVEVTLGYHGTKGFEMDGLVDAAAKAKLIADIKAILEVYVALYGTTKWDKDLLAKEFGSGFEMGLKFPIKYDSEKGLDLSTNSLEAKKPDINLADLFTKAAKDSFRESDAEKEKTD